MSKTQHHKDHNIVIKGRFVTSKSKDWKWMNSVAFSSYNGSKKTSYKGHYHYVGRKTFCTIQVRSKNKLASYAEYMNQQIKVTSQGHITKDGYLSNKQLKQWAQANPVAKGSPIWDYVISFKQDYFLKHNILTKQDAKQILDNTFDTFIQNNRMDPSGVVYIAQFHVDKPHHFHIHVRIHQTKETMWDWKRKASKVRTRGVLKTKSFEMWKDQIDYHLQKQQKLFQGLNLIRDQVQIKLKSNLQNNPNYDLNIAKQALEVKELIPRGRFQYQAIKDSLIKGKVDKLVKQVLDCYPEPHKTFNQGTALIKQKISLAKNQLTKDTNSRSLKNLNQLAKAKKQELWSLMANTILKLIKNHHFDQEASMLRKPNHQDQVKSLLIREKSQLERPRFESIKLNNFKLAKLSNNQKMRQISLNTLAKSLEIKTINQGKNSNHLPKIKRQESKKLVNLRQKAIRNVQINKSTLIKNLKKHKSYQLIVPGFNDQLQQEIDNLQKIVAQNIMENKWEEEYGR